MDQIGLNIKIQNILNKPPENIWKTKDVDICQDVECVIAGQYKHQMVKISTFTMLQHQFYKEKINNKKLQYNSVLVQRIYCYFDAKA